PVELSSDDPAVVRVEKDHRVWNLGRVTGVAFGRTKIRAKRGRLIGSAEVVVTNDPQCKEIRLHYDTLNLVLREQSPLEERPPSESSVPRLEFRPEGCSSPRGALEFYSSYLAESVVKVDPPTGIVEALGLGNQEVYVFFNRETGGWFQDVVTFIVRGAPCTTLDLIYKPDFVAVGQTAKPQLKYSPEGCDRPSQQPSFEIAADADSIAAQVDPKTGQLTGKAPGKPTVTVFHGDKLKSSATLEVSVPESNCAKMEIAYSPNAFAAGSRS